MLPFTGWISCLNTCAVYKILYSLVNSHFWILMSSQSSVWNPALVTHGLFSRTVTPVLFSRLLYKTTFILTTWRKHVYSVYAAFICICNDKNALFCLEWNMWHKYGSAETVDDARNSLNRVFYSCVFYCHLCCEQYSHLDVSTCTLLWNTY